MNRTGALFQVWLLVVLLLPGCSTARGARMFFPQTFGLEPLTARISVEPGMKDGEKETLGRALSGGKARAAGFFGELSSDPVILVCATMDCYRRFGGLGPLGTSRLGRILLSPKGVTPTIVCHEWTHVELEERVGRLRAILAVPQWFSEGLAVLSSRDERYAEDKWAAATDNGARAPRLEELATLQGWLRVSRANAIHSYGTAGREVARWYAAAGPRGLEALIEALRRNEPFAEAYERIGTGAAARKK